MDGGESLPEEGGVELAKPASLGASKKQQRIADLVKEQVLGALRLELEQALEARLEQVAAQPGAAPSAQPGVSRASRVIPPGGASAPTQDLRAEYQRRLRALRPGDLGAVLELKREFRNRGLEVY
ncbi:MAG: hypothetical protein KIT08_02770 [Anaerolineales bacterium]|nr:MAG: hypothetical protein KIT08_02770 [Anaerolineales bacterium]